MINTQELDFPVIQREYPPSPEQLTIFRYVYEMHKTGQSVKPVGAKSLDMSIRAVAGAGKSTTSVQLIQYFPPRYWVLYLTFMVASREDLEKKTAKEKLMLEGMEKPHANVVVESIHRLGKRFLGKLIKPELRVVSGKYRDLVGNWLEKHMSTGKEYDRGFAASVVKLVDMVQTRLLDPEDEQAILDLVEEYAEAIEIDMREFDEDGAEIVDKQWPLALSCLRYRLKKGIELATKDGVIDYIDMVWLISSRALNVRPGFTYNIVLVDEVQDTSPLEQEFAERCVRPKGGQLIIVGDPCQSIYHFKGTHMDSMQQLEARRNATLFSLNECYRCGFNIVDEAQRYNPVIRSFAKSQPGRVEELLAGDVTRRLQSGDAVLCRRRAPLVSLYIQLVKAGIRAKLKKVDAGPEVKTVLEKIEKSEKGFRLSQLPQFAERYLVAQTDLLNKNAKANEKVIEQLYDRIEMLLALFSWYEGMRNGKNLTKDDFIYNIGEFFRVDESAKILLTTVHSCKGLEFQRVYILEADDLKKRAFYSDENRFIAYVATTRAIDFLGLQVKALVNTLPVVVEEEKFVDSTIEEEEEGDEEVNAEIEEAKQNKRKSNKRKNNPVADNGRWKQVLQGTYTPATLAFLKYAATQEIFTDPDTGKHLKDRCNILEYALHLMPEYAIWQAEQLQLQAEEEARKQFEDSADAPAFPTRPNTVEEDKTVETFHKWDKTLRDQ